MMKKRKNVPRRLIVFEHFIPSDGTVWGSLQNQQEVEHCLEEVGHFGAL